MASVHFLTNLIADSERSHLIGSSRWFPRNLETEIKIEFSNFNLSYIQLDNPYLSLLSETATHMDKMYPLSG